jgi:hypothetical protein
MVLVISPPFPEIGDALPYPSPHGSKGRLHEFSPNMLPKTVKVFSIFVVTEPQSDAMSGHQSDCSI